MVYARLLRSVVQNRACEGKQAYKTRTEAKDVIKKMMGIRIIVWNLKF